LKNFEMSLETSDSVGDAMNELDVSSPDFVVARQPRSIIYKFLLGGKLFAIHEAAAAMIFPPRIALCSEKICHCQVSGVPRERKERRNDLYRRGFTLKINFAA
jgi:hypothetical protein